MQNKPKKTKQPILDFQRVDYEPTQEIGSMCVDALNNKWKYVGIIMGKPVRFKGKMLKMVIYRWLPDPMKI
jgi:hypothetical protein